MSTKRYRRTALGIGAFALLLQVVDAFVGVGFALPALVAAALIVGALSSPGQGNVVATLAMGAAAGSVLIAASAALSGLVLFPFIYGDGMSTYYWPPFLGFFAVPSIILAALASASVGLVRRARLRAR